LKYFFSEQVVDIEEMAWAPKYGLKGVIDASVRVKIHLDDKDVGEKVMPLEFKTGKSTSGQVSSYATHLCAWKIQESVPI